MAIQPRLDGDSRSWHFFCRADEPDLWCAVPAEQSVPNFLLSGAWRFGGHRMRPSGFRPSAALEAEALTGFYLFHRVR